MDLSAPYGIKYIQLGSQALPQKKTESRAKWRFQLLKILSTSSIQNEVTANRQMTVLKGNESTTLASENEDQFLLPKSKSTRRTTQQCQPFHLQMIQCFLETVPISRRCLGSMLPQLPLAAYKKKERRKWPKYKRLTYTWFTKRKPVT